MKNCIGLWSVIVRRKFYAAFSIVMIVLNIPLTFFDVDFDFRKKLFVALMVCLILIYIAIYLFEKYKKRLKLNILGSPVEIFYGDIFQQEGLKVISFNEYFDTLVDDKIIARRSLNGMYIDRYISDIPSLDKKIKQKMAEMGRQIGANDTRKSGKKIKYELGSVIEFNDYIFTAFSKFDEDDRAVLTMKEFQSFLLEFWSEIDKIYSGRTLVVPLLGSKIVRFTDCSEVSEQELLEILIWSFKMSRIKFRLPAKVKIVLHETVADKVNLSKIAFMYNL